MELDDDEYGVIEEVWGSDVPRNLDATDREQLIAMHDRITQAVQTAFRDDDGTALDLLLPLERKLVVELEKRV